MAVKSYVTPIPPVCLHPVSQSNEVHMRAGAVGGAL